MSKKIIYLICIILCLITIFMFSSKDSDESNHTSKTLINTGVNTYEKVTKKDVNNKKVVKTLNYPVRKCAHYTIYLILGIFVYLYIGITNINNKVLISIVFCLICAIFDETHQMFTGRTSKVLDVVIDTCGSITSILILNCKNKTRY